MSQIPHVTVSAGSPSTLSVADGSASGAEKSATTSTPPGKRPKSAAAPQAKLRSCVVCRSRKVRCDKESPCSNCRRANIACLFPSTDRPPRWARRLERITSNAATESRPNQEVDPGVGQVMERLRNLEGLVKELSGQLEHAHATARSTGTPSTMDSLPDSSLHDHNAVRQTTSASAGNTGNVQQQFGRLVLKDASRSRYVSSGFWARVDDELDGLKMETRELAGDDSDTSVDETSPGKSPPSTQEQERTPSERHGFLFRHNLNPASPNLNDFRPLPSQIPFLLDVFAENVNIISQIVHLPTVKKMLKGYLSNDAKSLTPANEALMFSIYYAAITSMEEDDIKRNFGRTKTDLNLVYRLGLEHALARADFLTVPDITLVQAFTVFLFLVRRHDSPRFVWMMTGLAIRMAQALGLHRDASHFDHLTPYEAEIRRRVWWALLILDVRASEDQGSDFTIAYGSFDTKMPLSIDDADIDPQTKELPAAREGITDMTIALFSIEMCQVARRMMIGNTASANKDGPSSLEVQGRSIQEMYQLSERLYLQYTTETENNMAWIMVFVVRVTAGKMILLTHLPILFASPNDDFTDEIRNKLLVSAIEVAEHNHALNAEPSGRRFRWVYQTYTHWHAIVYLLIEISRRSYLPVMERAWFALHSSWLIPAQSKVDKNLRIWVPLRRLMAKARKHRDAELERLRDDAWAARQLEAEDSMLAIPASPGKLSAEDHVAVFRGRWRKLVGLSEDPKDYAVSAASAQPGSTPAYGDYNIDPSSAFMPASTNSQHSPANSSAKTSSATPLSPYDPVPQAQAVGGGSSFSAFPSVAADWDEHGTGGPGLAGWLWADPDPNTNIFVNVGADGSDFNMDLDGDLDWSNWVESAKGMEWESMPGAGGQSSG